MSAIALSSIPTVAAQLGLAKSPFLSLVSIWRGDITRLQVAAVVNAAAPELLGGGGVDGAIHDAAGPELLEECRGLNGCATGQAKITRGYRLPAQRVIHTVGPVGERPELLASSYRTSLDLAKANGLRTIAFPCVSTGVYGYPAEAACRVVLPTVKQWVEQNPGAIDRIVFCMFNDKSVAIYDKTIREYA
ncbi:O-acetyl-ADP-ribose deacetylase macrod2 [Coemansia sp. Benny D115]|nr:O-acetyl-ADP-ribose deacetylase macrod2 [Coemansia sp. Benny D115]